MRGRKGAFIRRVMVALALGAVVGLGSFEPAMAQDKGSVNPKPLPPLKNPNDPKTPAKQLFGRKTVPTSGAAQPVGFYSKGCLAGAAMLPTDGQTWQVMRLSRNRNWAHPDMVAVVQKLSASLPSINGWNGLLVGDMSQPRGGPMITGHASHQIGLDADIWLTPMPDRTLTRAEREQMSATDMVRADRLDIDPSVWTPGHTALIRAAASNPKVERIFVNPAIKRALCREAGRDRGWLAKVRPMWGHNYHFHIRIGCPAGAAYCSTQAAISGRDECGEELDKWFTPDMLNPKPSPPGKPLTMADLPAACRDVLDAE